MTFPYKAIFVDLDGTLLNSQKNISHKNLECLNNFIENGVHVVVATGRTIKSVRRIVSSLNLQTPVITLNGNNIFNKIDGYSMKISYLENSIRDKIYDFCKYANAQFAIENILIDTGKTFYVLNPHKLDSEEFMHHYDEQPSIFDFNSLPNEQVVSCLFLLSNGTSRHDFIAAQHKFLPEDVKICTFNGWPWLEIGSPKSNKGVAMEFVCEYLGISCNEVIAFGDGENDVEMLQKSGLGVAMANADTHALAAANAIALSHDEDGVSVYLENLMHFKEQFAV